MMKEIDARVTGFDYTTFHAYTTEVEVDGRTWTLAIRYNTFYQFYTRLTALEKHFTVDFPPKGGLLFSPPPEERQEQLDDFMLSTLAYFDMRGHPKRMEALLGELLQIREHMDIKDEDEERTASEGSSVAEELLLDTPMPGHDEDDDDFGQEDDNHDDAQEDKTTPQIAAKENQAEAGVEAAQEVTKKLKAEVIDDDSQTAPREHQEFTAVENREKRVMAPGEDTKPEAVENELEEKPEVSEIKPKGVQVAPMVVLAPKAKVQASPVQRQQSQGHTGGAVTNSYIAMLRRMTLVDGAIQAAVVSTMKGNVKKSAKEEKEVKPAEPVEVQTQEVKPAEPAMTEIQQEQMVPVPESLTAPMEEEKLAASEEPAVQTETIHEEMATTAIEAPVPVLKEREDVSTAPEEEVVELLESEMVVPAPSSTSETEEVEPSSPVVSVQEDKSSSGKMESDKAISEPSKTESESENLVVSWFRRMSTFSASAAESEELEAVTVEKQQDAVPAHKDQEGNEDEANAYEKTIAAVAEAKAKTEAEAKEAAEAELLRAEQELNLRLKLYRHPVFFQEFNCDVGTSRYSLPQRVSDGIIV